MTTADTDYASVGRRARRRARLGMPAEARGSSGEWHRIILANLSASGCKIERVPAGLTGPVIWLRLEGAEPLEARVRWEDATGLGCEFLSPLAI